MATLPLFWQIVLVLVAAAFVYKVAVKIFDFFDRLIKGILAAPGKGLKKLVNYSKDRKLNKAQKKYDNAILEADIKARINAGYNNDSYQKSAKVKKAKAKLDFYKSKEN